MAGGKTNAEPFFSCSVRNNSRKGADECSDSESRLSLYEDPRQGEVSLLIRKVQLTDNGAYYCRVEVEYSWWGYSQKEKQLLVTGKSLSKRGQVDVT